MDLSDNSPPPLRVDAVIFFAGMPDVARSVGHHQVKRIPSLSRRPSIRSVANITWNVSGLKILRLVAFLPIPYWCRADPWLAPTASVLGRKASKAKVVRAQSQSRRLHTTLLDANEL